MNHSHFNQAAIAQIFKHFISFPFSSALLRIGVAWLIQILFDFFKPFAQLMQTILQFFFVFPHINRFHYIQPLSQIS